MHPLVADLFGVQENTPTPIPLGVGTWQFDRQHWGFSSAGTAKAVLRRAFVRGIRHFDTAESYGNGRSEQYLGQTFRNQLEVSVATKSVARKGQSLVSHFAKSMGRLERSPVDLFYIHWPRPDVSFSDAVDTIEKLKDSGKSRYIGLCNIDVDDDDHRRALRRVDAIQFGFNPVWRREEDRLLSFARSAGVATIAYSPFQQGLLSHRFERSPSWPENDHRKKTPLFREPAWTHVYDFHDKYHSLCEENHVLPAAMALIWAANHGIDAVVAGFRSRAQLDQLLDGLAPAMEHPRIDLIVEEIESLSLDLQPHLPDLPNVFGYSPV